MSSPDVTKDEEQALLRAFRSGWIAPLGPEVDAFEVELALFNERRFCVALSSGTAALHLGLLTLGVGPGDVVLTSTMTFAATTNAITYTGATAVLVDCDETGSINPALLAEALTDQQQKGARVAAIVPVDLLGKIVDHDRIGELAHRHGIPVLSDAAESLGARRAGRPSGGFGTAAVLSFNGNKVMTTSGGGALLTDDERLAERTRYLATQARMPVVHYEHQDVGYNYRLSNLLAGLGRAQLRRLPAMIARRREMRQLYESLLVDVPGVLLFGVPDGRKGGATVDNFWLTSILVDQQVAGWSRGELMAAFAAQNIEARPLWKPMHAQPVYSHLPAYLDGTSDRLFAQGLSLPSGSSLDAASRERVVGCILAFLRERV